MTCTAVHLTHICYHVFIFLAQTHKDDVLIFNPAFKALIGSAVSPAGETAAHDVTSDSKAWNQGTWSGDIGSVITNAGCPANNFILNSSGDLSFSTPNQIYRY